ARGYVRTLLVAAVRVATAVLDSTTTEADADGGPAESGGSRAGPALDRGPAAKSESRAARRGQRSPFQGLSLD
ncbi:hypothetical protein, partial [Pantanalinema sp. GBBB05]|uniref:hypothetical protein n=1 Tax=Pantanalinema sp. GBBB05 TaxID=2604139 RepID=UPI003D819D6C